MTLEQLRSLENTELPPAVRNRIQSTERAFASPDPNRLSKELQELNLLLRNLPLRQKEAARSQLVTALPERIRNQYVIRLSGAGTIDVIRFNVALVSNGIGTHRVLGDFRQNFSLNGVDTTTSDFRWSSANLTRFREELGKRLPQENTLSDNYTVMTALASFGVYSQGEVVRRVTAAEQRLHKRGIANPSPEQIVAEFTPDESREVLASTMRYARTELLARALSQFDSMSAEFDRVIAENTAETPALSASRLLAQRYRIEVAAAAAALGEHHISMERRSTGNPGWAITAEGQQWVEERNRMVTWLQDLLRCEVGDYRNRHRVPPLHAAILEFRQARYNDLFRQARSAPRNSPARASFDREGRQIVGHLANWTRINNEYQMTVAALGLTGHQLLQRISGDARHPSSPGSTPEEEFKSFQEYLRQETGGSLEAFNEHLRIVREEVLADGLMLRVEDFWNRHGREGVDAVTRGMTNILVSVIPNDVARRFARTSIQQAIPSMLEWPLDDQGEAIPWDRLNDTQREQLRKRLDSVRQSIIRFQDTQALPNLEGSLRVMTFLNAHVRDENLFSILGENEQMPADLQNLRMTEENTRNLLQQAGNNRHRKAWIVLRCIQQMNNDGVAYHNAYGQLINDIHDVTGTHFPGENNGMPWWAWVLIGAGVGAGALTAGSYVIGGAGGLTHWASWGNGNRIPTGIRAAIRGNPLALAGRTLQRIVNGPFALTHRIIDVVQGFRQGGGATGALRTALAPFWEIPGVGPGINAPRLPGSAAIPPAQQNLVPGNARNTPPRYTGPDIQRPGQSAGKQAAAVEREASQAGRGASRFSRVLTWGGRALVVADVALTTTEIANRLANAEAARKQLRAEIAAALPRPAFRPHESNPNIYIHVASGAEFNLTNLFTRGDAFFDEARTYAAVHGCAMLVSVASLALSAGPQAVVFAGVLATVSVANEVMEGNNRSNLRALFAQTPPQVLALVDPRSLARLGTYRDITTAFNNTFMNTNMQPGEALRQRNAAWENFLIAQALRHVNAQLAEQGIPPELLLGNRTLLDVLRSEHQYLLNNTSNYSGEAADQELQARIYARGIILRLMANSLIQKRRQLQNHLAAVGESNRLTPVQEEQLRWQITFLENQYGGRAGSGERQGGQTLGEILDHPVYRKALVEFGTTPLRFRDFNDLGGGVPFAIRYNWEVPSPHPNPQRLVETANEFLTTIGAVEVMTWIANGKRESVELSDPEAAQRQGTPAFRIRRGNTDVYVRLISNRLMWSSWGDPGWMPIEGGRYSAGIATAGSPQAHMNMIADVLTRVSHELDPHPEPSLLSQPQLGERLNANGFGLLFLRSITPTSIVGGSRGQIEREQKQGFFRGRDNLPLFHGQQNRPPVLRGAMPDFERTESNGIVSIRVGNRTVEYGYIANVWMWRNPAGSADTRWYLPTEYRFAASVGDAGRIHNEIADWLSTINRMGWVGATLEIYRDGDSIRSSNISPADRIPEEGGSYPFRNPSFQNPTFTPPSFNQPYRPFGQYPFLPSTDRDPLGGLGFRRNDPPFRSPDE